MSTSTAPFRTGEEFSTPLYDRLTSIPRPPVTTQSNYSLADVDRTFARSGRRSATRRARRSLRKPVTRVVLAAVAGVAATGALVTAASRIELGSDAPATRAGERAVASAPCPIPAPYRDDFQFAARHTGVSLPLLAAMAHEESRMDPVARSHAGALGLLQVMPETAREMRANPLNPGANVYAGAQYLRRMQRRFGRLDVALAAYNAGPSVVARHGPGPVSGAYAARVERRAAGLQSSCS
jgi:soluble lytic murein transglycosylase-like protein